MSVFTPKLGTNYCPTDDEVHEINALLIEPSAQLRQLDNKIGELRKAMEELVVERNRVAEYVDAHKTLISPMRRIPIDVLQEIFVACLATERNCIMSASEAPILLGRICSSWRAISMSTPRLWASLHIVEPSAPFSADSVYVTRARDARLAQRLETAKSWLARSGRCPLSISLLVESLGQEYSSSEIESWPAYSFLQVMIWHLPQWRRIELRVPHRLVEALRKLTGKDVPLLQSLNLDLLVVQLGADPLSPPLELLTAPQLADLHVTGIQTQVDALGLPYDQLTSVSLNPFPWAASQPTLEASLSVIAKCRQLRWFHVTVYASTPGMQDIHIESLTLEVLVINYSKGTTIPGPLRSLNYLSLPALVHLSVIWGQGGFSDNTGVAAAADSSFERFFSISTRLRSLRLDAAFLEKETFMALVRALPPSLRRLAVHDFEPWSVDDEFLKLITPNSTACSAGIEDIVIHHCHDISDRALLEFIRAKMTPGSHSPLKRVRMQLGRPMEFDILPEVQSFLGAGLNLVVDYRDPILFSATGMRPAGTHTYDWSTDDV
ncbi:hypothetical protein C8F01DRAFT_128353 [Mycena amicta]|nr:hypothetical protein C8F01DRAFT_128353 [Mycena amicta]